jgi:Raf kinase inhibitor-like YbhB/YbcL family protein
MYIASPDFEDGHHMSDAFTCDGEGQHPELQVHEIPPEAKSLALIVEDPDASDSPFTHWLLWNIPPQHPLVIPHDGYPEGAVEGMNGSGRYGWLPACPPPGSPEHHYHFKVYALDRMIEIDHGASKADLRSELDSYILAKAEFVGKYAR